MKSLERDILNDPAASRWLKQQVELLDERDIVDFMNDVEILNEVLDNRYQEIMNKFKAAKGIPHS